MSNFLGKPFSQWVKNQVEVRQTSLGKFSPISDKDLQYYTTKTPFLRLASSVNLTNKGSQGNQLDNSVLQKLVSSGVSEELIKGDKLAKNFILQGGVVDENGGLKFGLNNGSSIFNGAYGWGGVNNNSRGYVPMPGITQADVTYYNNGALSKTTINVRCFSKEQFQLFDVLYLRPGYTLLLEFGHSQFLKKSGDKVTLETFPDFLTTPMSLMLEGNTSQFGIVDAIEKARETYQGNYEAVFGKITKFNWQFNTDGSYDCQIQLTSVGDVIESLKVNITSDSKVPVTEEEGTTEDTTSTDDPPEPPLIANATKTIINSFLFKTYQKIKESVVDPGAKTINTKELKIEGFRDQKGNKPKTLTFPKGIIYRTGVTTDDGSENPQVYMKYGAFLSFIQAKLLLYDLKTETPHFVFDMNFDDLDNDENVILRIPGQISADPRVCLIPYSNFSIKDDAGGAIELGDTAANTVLKGTNFFYKQEQYLGRLANIMVNINYIVNTLAGMSQDEEGNIKLIDFLRTLQTGMINVTGGINKYDLRMSQDGTKVQFIEEIPQRLSNPPAEVDYTRFNVYGVKPGVMGSFVRDVNLTADLGQNFATMISIGAQSNGNQLGGNATSFSNYNAGLKDRIIQEKVSSPDADKEEQTGSETVSKQQQLADIITQQEKTFTSIYANTQWNNEDVASYKENMSTAIELALGILTDANGKKKAQLQAPFFLPFNLSLTIDGLSGMKLYQKFLMTDDILPPSYEKDGVDLQLKGVNHKIDSSAWLTEMETLSVPRDVLSPVARPPQQTAVKPSQTYTRKTGNLPPTSDVEPPPSSDPTSVTRFDAMQKSYNEVFKRDGQVSGMCARWSYNMAANYVSFLRGGQLVNPQLAAGGNANNNLQYYNNLVKLGYVKSQSTGLTKAACISKIQNTTWGYGDVIAYYANDEPPAGSNTHWKYGHTQIYVGSINSIGWSTSKSTNYNTDFPYRSRQSNNWNLLIFRAPAT
jgi:hypothetical protein